MTDPIASPTAGPARLLVCDDDDRVRFATARILRKAGYEVVEAENGSQCLELIGRERPQIALVDWVMPDIEGSEVCRRIKADPELASIAVVLVTGIKTSDSDKAAGLEIGADGYLTHPLNQRVFLAHVAALLRMQRAEANLRQRQHLATVGLLAGGIAHEFNNRLMGILNYAEMSRDELAADHPVIPFLESIISDAQHAAELTRQLLGAAASQNIQPRVLDLNETVESIVKVLRGLLPGTVTLAWHPESDIWPVTMDPNQVRQILVHLCTNARDALSDSGQLTISTRNLRDSEREAPATGACPPGEYVELAVSDTGCGMSPETTEQAFIPFFTTKEVGQGVGLGLSTVRGIVRQNDGHLHLTSAPGSGTTVSVHIPRCSSQQQSGAPHARK